MLRPSKSRTYQWRLQHGVAQVHPSRHPPDRWFVFLLRKIQRSKKTHEDLPLPCLAGIRMNGSNSKVFWSLVEEEGEGELRGRSVLSSNGSDVLMKMTKSGQVLVIMTFCKYTDFVEKCCVHLRAELTSDNFSRVWHRSIGADIQLTNGLCFFCG